MKRIAFLMIVVAFLVLLSGVVEQTEESGISQPNQSVQQIISGGGYRLTIQVFRVGGSISGGTYQLFHQAVPSLQGNGCCCTYLPCLINNAP